MMKITFVGWILIIALVIAALLILNISVENPSLAQWLSNIRKAIKSEALSSTGPGTSLE